MILNSITCTNITTSLWLVVVGDWGFLSEGSGPWSEESTFVTAVTHYSDPVWTTERTISAFPATYNPCKPLLSMPQQILSLDPSWVAANCTADLMIVRDPWEVLTSSAGFFPLTTPQPVPSYSIVGASAGASIPYPIATKTGAPLPSPTLLPPEELQSLPISKLPAALTIGKTIVTCNSNSEYVFGPDTLAPNSQITHSNTILSLGPNGHYLEIGGTTTQFLNPSFMVGPSTITAGGLAATINGKTYSILPGGSSIAIDGSTEPLNSATQASNNIQEIMVTAKGYIINSQTLMAGGAPITSSGTILSLEPDGENVVVVVSTTIPMSVLLGSSTNAATGEGSAEDGVVGTSIETTSTLVPTAATTPQGEIKLQNGASKLRQGGYWFIWLALFVVIIGAA